jgi:hypothetical protein
MKQKWNAWWRWLSFGTLRCDRLDDEGSNSSETSVNIYQTRGNIPEDSNLRNRRRENLKSHEMHDTRHVEFIKILILVSDYSRIVV